MKNPKNTRDYGKFSGPRRNFAGGGYVNNTEWQPPAEFEDASGNPMVGHYDLWGKLKPGESPEQETKNTLAHPGRTVSSFGRLDDIYPAGTAEANRQLNKVLAKEEGARQKRIEASDKPADMGYKAARDLARTPAYYDHSKDKPESGGGGVE